MPLPTVTAGQQILATDINNHLTQTNTNTGNIATNTTNIATNTSNIATNTTNIAQNTNVINLHTTSINSLQTTVNGYNNVPKDNQLASTGGNLVCNSITITKNSLTRISTFSGTGSGSVNHGLGDVPDLVMLTYAGNFGTAPTQALAWYGAGGTSVNVSAQSGYFWTGLAIKF